MNLLNVLLLFSGNDITAATPDAQKPVTRAVVPSSNLKATHRRLAQYGRTAARNAGFGAAVLANTVGFLFLMSGLLVLLQIAQATLA
jgi:hypothetical protein